MKNTHSQLLNTERSYEIQNTLSQLLNTKTCQQIQNTLILQIHFKFINRKPKTYKTNKQTATTTNEFRVTTLGQEIEKEKKYRKYASCVKID